MKERDYHLDGWRGLAIGSVLIAHFLSIYNPRIGRFGVDLFFVLSGLLMSRILFEQKTPLATFYRRRASRILPVFIAFLMVVFGVFAWTGDVVTPKEALASLTFTRTYIGDTPIGFSGFPIGHLWSLNVEEHSYLALSLITLLPLARAGKGWLMIAIAGCMAVAMALYWRFAPPEADYMMRTEVAALPLFLSAGYRQVRHHFVRWVRPWMAPLALCLAVLCYIRSMPGELRVLGMAAAPFLLAFAVNHIGDAQTVAKRALEWRPLRMLGIWSFSIYLWQHPFYELANAHRLPAWVAFACAMCVGVASYHAYEQPVRNWLNARWGHKGMQRADAHPSRSERAQLNAD